SQATEMAIGRGSGCVRNSNQTVQCWGEGFGSGTTLLNLSGVVGLASTESIWRMHYLALMADGSIRCWGQNEGGQCGSGSISSEPISPLSPVLVSGIQDAVKVQAGDMHSCALHADGRVSCWGVNGGGFDYWIPFSPLGQASGPAYYATPQYVPGIAGAVDLKTSGSTSCAKLISGQLKCWGGDMGGMLTHFPQSEDPYSNLNTGVSSPVTFFTHSGMVHEFWVTRSAILYREKPNGPVFIRGQRNAFTIPESAVRSIMTLP
ncbi:MAG: hypothetical protein KGP28_06425, partial [Bdellovibrionales bacterium]|nr:hypothetical protein [Bdellovibrionales bacterium]